MFFPPHPLYAHPHFSKQHFVFPLLLCRFPPNTSPPTYICYSHSPIGYYTNSPIGPIIHAFIGSLPLLTTYIKLGFLLAHILSWTDHKKGSIWILKRCLIVLNWCWWTAQEARCYIRQKLQNMRGKGVCILVSSNVVVNKPYHSSNFWVCRVKYWIFVCQISTYLPRTSKFGRWPLKMVFIFCINAMYYETVWKFLWLCGFFTVKLVNDSIYVFTWKR